MCTMYIVKSIQKISDQKHTTDKLRKVDQRSSLSQEEEEKLEKL